VDAETAKKELGLILFSLGLHPLYEYRFHPVRKWRFDYAWPAQKVAIEFDGGVWARGRHNRPGGYIKDCEKKNEATFMGWKVFTLTSELVNLDNIRKIAWTIYPPDTICSKKQ
jgi:very-short-patch-repair endonuclease